MRDEISRGKRAAEAAVSARLLLQPSGPSRVLVARLLAASRELDPAAALDLHVFYAGNAFIARPTRRRLPGTYLGDSLRAAVRTVQDQLGEDRSGAAGGTTTTG